MMTGVSVIQWSFNGSWDEEAVMVEAFVAVLDPNAPAPKYSSMIFTSLILLLLHSYYRIRTMKACGGQLKIPHVPAGHKWTAPIIKAVCNNGDLYVTGFGKTLRMEFFQKIEFDAWLISSTIELTHVQVLG